MTRSGALYSSETKDLKRSLHDTTQRFIARSYNYKNNVTSLEVHSIHMAKYLMEQVMSFTSLSMYSFHTKVYFLLDSQNDGTDLEGCNDKSDARQ